MIYDLSQPAALMAALLPDLLLMAGAMALALLAAWRPASDAHQRLVGQATLVVLATSLGSVVLAAVRGGEATAGVIAVDGFRWAVDVVVLLAAMGTVALNIEQQPRDGIRHAESHVLVALAASGMMVLAAARDLMVIFLGIEIMSIAIYALVGLNRRSARSAEASLKYFLLGAFATAFLLYGIALIYGATGQTQLGAISAAITRHALALDPMLMVGIGLLVIGFGFKVAAVPFHMWAPDVYDGAPTPVAAFMASGVKAAAFATLLRILYEAFYLVGLWMEPVAWIAIVTMVVGNLVALSQRDIKRMLAYSGIVHTGYLLVAAVAATDLASTAFTFYMLGYTLATIGAFAIVGLVQREGEEGAPLAAYAGLWSTRPWLAAGMAVFLLAFLGFPVFGGLGFFGKWYLLSAAIDAPGRLVVLAIVIVLTSVLSAGYYLPVIRAMFMEPRPEGAPSPAPTGRWTRAVLVVTAGLILVCGLLPSSLATVALRNGFAPHAIPDEVRATGAGVLR